MRQARDEGGTYNRRMPEEGSASIKQVAGREARARRGRWNWLLLTPLALLVYPGLYARATPVLFGFPFFYWYQFAVVVLTALLTGLVYLATRGRAKEDGGA
jgi:hypothetical protein